MRLGINEITAGIREAAVNKTIRQLKQEGFTVVRDYRLSQGGISAYEIDIYAYNDYERRIYEFKLGQKRIRKEQYIRLQNFAKEMKARLFVIYLEIPISKRIMFNGIENILFGHLSEYTPEELLGISEYVKVLDVVNIDINALDMDNELVNIRGTGVIRIEFKNETMKNGNYHYYIEKDELDFSFRLRLDVASREILHSYYKIDTSWYDQ